MNTMRERERDAVPKIEPHMELRRRLRGHNTTKLRMPQIRKIMPSIMPKDWDNGVFGAECRCTPESEWIINSNIIFGRKRWHTFSQSAERMNWPFAFYAWRNFRLIACESSFFVGTRRFISMESCFELPLLRSCMRIFFKRSREHDMAVFSLSFVSKRVAYDIRVNCLFWFPVGHPFDVENPNQNEKAKIE